jgi:hypothetical protein
MLHEGGMATHDLGLREAQDRSWHDETGWLVAAR